jgi:hypothetical protein
MIISMSPFILTKKENPTRDRKPIGVSKLKNSTRK